MRHKYETRGIVLSRFPLGETSAAITLLTPDLGVVRARSQGLRHSGAKLAAALATFAESDLVLVRGKEEWRVAGAVLAENWFTRMSDPAARARAARVCGLLLRLVVGEAQEPTLFPALRGFFEALTMLPADMHEAAEVVAVLHILAALGLDAGEIVGVASAFTREPLAEVGKNRTRYIARINRDITASGL